MRSLPYRLAGPLVLVVFVVIVGLLTRFWWGCPPEALAKLIYDYGFAAVFVLLVLCILLVMKERRVAYSEHDERGYKSATHAYYGLWAVLILGVLASAYVYLHTNVKSQYVIRGSFLLFPKGTKVKLSERTALLQPNEEGDGLIADWVMVSPDPPAGRWFHVTITLGGPGGNTRAGDFLIKSEYYGARVDIRFESERAFIWVVPPKGEEELLRERKIPKMVSSEEPGPGRPAL